MSEKNKWLKSRDVLALVGLDKRVLGEVHVPHEYDQYFYAFIDDPEKGSRRLGKYTTVIAAKAAVENANVSAQTTAQKAEREG